MGIDHWGTDKGVGKGLVVYSWVALSMKKNGVRNRGKGPEERRGAFLHLYALWNTSRYDTCRGLSQYVAVYSHCA